MREKEKQPAMLAWVIGTIIVTVALIVGYFVWRVLYFSWPHNLPLGR